MPSSRAIEEADNHVKDTIVLTIPTDSAYRGVASLVLGGIGTRLDLPYERMDDLQLAFDANHDAVVEPIDGNSEVRHIPHESRV